MVNIEISGYIFQADREAVYDIETALSELHGRVLAQAAKCCDMEEGTKLVISIPNLVNAYNDIEKACANIDDREPNPIRMY